MLEIGHQCKNSVRSIPHEPAVLLAAVNFGKDPSPGGESRKTFFLSKPGSPQKCTEHDEYAVAYLSNFSINNNFSHFLHSLLRLFCALIDSGFIEWDPSTQSFIHRVKYSIWLDEFFRLTKEKEGWLRSFYPAGKATFRQLAAVKSGQCVSSSKMLYGSGCVRLLPPGTIPHTVLYAFFYLHTLFGSLPAPEFPYRKKLVPTIYLNNLSISFFYRKVVRLSRLQSQ